MRLIFITDFTEQFSYRLLRGIINYSRETEPWVVCKMPPSVKKQKGLDGLLDFAIKWKADVIIGQFLPTEDVSMFRKYGIVAIAQDYIKKFDCIPNITADYEGTGALAAKRFISRGFQNFGFFGYRNVCWSDDRCKGFHDQLVEAGFGDHFYDSTTDLLWVSDSEAAKLFVFDGEVTKLKAIYDVSYIGNAESVCVDHARGCVWVGDDGSTSKIYKIMFTNL